MSKIPDIKHNLSLISRAVTLLEPRFTTRALRSLPALRKKLGDDGRLLAHVIKHGKIYPEGECTGQPRPVYTPRPGPRGRVIRPGLKDANEHDCKTSECQH